MILFTQASAQSQGRRRRLHREEEDVRSLQARHNEPRSSIAIRHCLDAVPPPPCLHICWHRCSLRAALRCFAPFFILIILQLDDDSSIFTMSASPDSLSARRRQRPGSLDIKGGANAASNTASPPQPRRPSISLFRLSCPDLSADVKAGKAQYSHMRSRSVSGRLVEDDITLLPFLKRPQEVNALVFDTPANSKLASRLKRWVDSHEQDGKRFMYTLTQVDRDEMNDERWTSTLRNALVKDVPDLWASLALALGADALTPLNDSRQRSRRGSGSAQEDSIDDASSSASGLSTPSSGSFSFSGPKLAPLTAIAPVDRAAATSSTSTVDASTHTSTVADSHGAHRHQPSMDAGPSKDTGPSTERWRSLRFHRPLSSTGAQDDGEALTPQRSQYSFARTFEGPTMMNARSSRRPKAYSMTHYLSSRELSRLDAGKEADITPYEEAAKLEAEGCEKPPSLGTLKDGRTRHPSAGTPQDASAVAAIRASLGLSPTCPSPKLAGSGVSASSSKACSDVEDDGEREKAKRPTQRSSLAERPGPSSRHLDDRPEGDMGLDFGGGQCEEGTDKFTRSGGGGPLSPMSPPWSPAHRPLHQRSRSESERHQQQQPPQSPHLVFPLSPRADYSRGAALSSLLDESASDLSSVRNVLGPSAWSKTRNLLSGVERNEASDAKLLERLALECFDLVDLDEQDEVKRREAEDRMCEDLEAYRQRWKAFVELLTVLRVPRASIAEAERRCAPGEALF